MASAFPPWTFPDPGEPPPSTLPLRGPPQVKRKRSRNNLEDEDIKPDLANLSFQETDGEPSLTFGKLGSFGFNIEETKAASSESYSRPEVGESSNTIVKAVFDGAVRTDPLLEAATPVMKVFPRCRIWDRPHPPTYFHKASSRVAGEINFLESVHLDSGVPRSLLTALVSEAHQEECNRQIRDNYRGNILRVFNTGLDVDHQFLALPGGLLGNELFFMPIRYPSLSDGRAVKPCPWLRPSAVFQTPILQISSSELTPSPSMSRLFAVRSFGAVTLGYVKSESLSTIGSRILQTRAFPSDPLHVAFNPFVPLEAAVVTDDGSIYMMEAGEDGPGTVRTSIACSQDWLDVDNASTSDSRAVWRRLCYGWDPEILLVGGPDSVSSLDLREAQRQLKPFISQDGKSLFCAMNRSPVDPYKLALCSTRHTMIYDCRFSKRPFMQWGIQNILDPPVEVEFFSVRSEESMIAWNSRHAEAIVYSTWKSPTDPAPLDQLGPFTRDTNHHQSPPHTRHRPQRLEPYFRNGMGSLLLIDPLRHTLPFEIGIAPLSTMPRRQLVANFLSGGTHSQARDRMTSDRKWSEYMRNAPPWPPLAGLAVSVRNDRAIVFQAAVDGAVYAQQMDVVASGEVPNAEGSPISPNAEEPDRDEVDAWFAHVEKIAKDHYAQQPHLKRPMRGKDLGCFFQFFKRSLRDPPLNPLFGEDPDAALITAEGAQELQVTIEKAVDFIEQKSRPTTLLEVYKHVTSRVWSYDDAGRPVMEHLRPQAHLLSPAVLDRIVSKLNEKAETSAGTDRNRVDRRFFRVRVLDGSFYGLKRADSLMEPSDDNPFSTQSTLDLTEEQELSFVDEMAVKNALHAWYPADTDLENSSSLSDEQKGEKRNAWRWLANDLSLSSIVFEHVPVHADFGNEPLDIEMEPAAGDDDEDEEEKLVGVRGISLTAFIGHDDAPWLFEKTGNETPSERSASASASRASSVRAASESAGYESDGSSGWETETILSTAESTRDSTGSFIPPAVIIREGVFNKPLRLTALARRLRDKWVNAASWYAPQTSETIVRARTAMARFGTKKGLSVRPSRKSIEEALEGIRTSAGLDASTSASVGFDPLLANAGRNRKRAVRDKEVELSAQDFGRLGEALESERLRATRLVVSSSQPSQSFGTSSQFGRFSSGAVGGFRSQASQSSRFSVGGSQSMGKMKKRKSGF